MVDYYDNKQAELWIYDMFYVLYNFNLKYGNASGSILYSYLVLDEDFVKLTPQILKYEIASIDPYTILTLVAGSRTSEKTKTKRLNCIFNVLEEHCKYEEISFGESVLPQFTLLNYNRCEPVPAFTNLERSLEQQIEIWNIFKIIHDKDVPVAAFSKDLFERCNNTFNGCDFNQFTVFLHYACSEEFTPLTKETREFYLNRGVKRISYKWYSEQIGYHERNCEAPEYYNHKYLLI